MDQKILEKSHKKLTIMDSIDKWLKSLRLHKYTHLFKTLTYEQMLTIDEKFLIDLDITKGARNKILVSVKKLNLRPERLINMIDDLNQGNISMKEALNVLKEILVTPIPHPYEESRSKLTASCSPSSVSSSTATSESDFVVTSLSDQYSLTTDYSDPHDLTKLFVDTFEKLVKRLIESPCFEDSSCHGIMADIIDECLEHNSFTSEQKAKMARYKQCILPEQKAKLVRYNKYNHNHHHHHHYHNNNSSSISNNNNNSHHHYHHHNNHNNSNHQLQQHQQYLNVNQNQYQHQRPYHVSRPRQHRQPGSRIAQAYQPSIVTVAFGEYSLLGPGKTFELPCLRAQSSRNK